MMTLIEPYQIFFSMFGSVIFFNNTKQRKMKNVIVHLLYASIASKKLSKRRKIRQKRNITATITFRRKVQHELKSNFV